MAIFGAPDMDVVMGFWFIVSIIAAAIIRKPGVALVSEVMAAAVQVLLGSPAGLLLLLTGLVQGAGAEAVFAATRWRRYSLPVLMAAGMGAAVFSFAYTWIRFDYGSLAPGLLVAMFALRLASGALLGGFLGHVIVKALYRTGVLSGLAIRPRHPHGRMPDALTYDRVTLRHDGAAADAVGPVSLTLSQGERVLLLGPSGAGKSTLLHAATGLMPASVPGTRRGEIRLNGQPVTPGDPPNGGTPAAISSRTPARPCRVLHPRRKSPSARRTGALRPHVSRVWSPRPCPRRPGENWADRRIATLSGGERQCVAIAALMAQGAPIALADEPTASLAPMAARRMADLLLMPGCTTLVVEHKPRPILDRIDRCIAIGRSGRVIVEGPPEDVFPGQADALASEGISLPLGIRLNLALPDLIGPGGCMHRPQAAPSAAHLRELRTLILPDPISPGETLVTLSEAACAPAFGPVVLRNVSLELRAGEVLAIVGPNGAGKTTLAACLAGLLPPRAGRRTGPPGAVAFQNPEAHFSRESVRAEFETIERGCEAVSRILDRWGLARVADQHPFTLSQGQKRRLALALLAESDRWPVLILDEPTAGLDGTAETALRARIRTLASERRGLAVITHDLDFALSVADRALLVERGGIRFDGPCSVLMLDTARLTAAGLLPPAAAPLLHWLEGSC